MSPAIAAVLPRKKLPIGIQNLREIRKGSHYYVDKSGLAIDLIESGKAFFLSRPRRFGKSLLVDTFKELFEGNAALDVTTQARLIDVLKAADLPALESLLKALFASIPHDWYRNNPLAGFEGHYASVFYSHFAALGLNIRLEDTTNHGRIDMAVRFERQVFLFEFKVVEAEAPTGEALAQIEARGYADKYLGQGWAVHLVGIEFGRAARNLVGFAWRTT